MTITYVTNQVSENELVNIKVFIQKIVNAQLIGFPSEWYTYNCLFMITNEFYDCTLSVSFIKKIISMNIFRDHIHLPGGLMIQLKYPDVHNVALVPRYRFDRAVMRSSADVIL